ncbi:MAG: peptide ABC transporter substrate-binding protein [Acidobacteria bacterium]|nr:peptide ABC transporter substrate-binding protein [Acidobacteriota bacterium]
MRNRELFVRVALALVVAVAGLSSGCERHSEYFGRVEPPKENVFRFNNGAEPQYVDPGLMSGQPDGRIAQMLFEGLMVMDWKTLQPMPGVAERWEVSADGLTYTFHLRGNAMWSDGTPVTANDFVYSWTRVLDPKTASVYAAPLFPIVNAEEFNQRKLDDPSRLGLRAIGDHTFEVRLRRPVPYFLFLASFMYCFMPVPQAVIEKYGMHWTDPGNIVGNGPFVLVEHRINSKFELARNPRYWDKQRVRLERVIAYSIDDHSTSANMYKAGALDWVPSGGFPDDYVRYMRGRFRDLRTMPFLATYFYSMNVTRPPLNNKLVRQALAMAIDRRAITDDLLRKGDIPGAQLVAAGFSDYHSPPGLEYNPQKAAELLAKAGYPNGQGFPSLEMSFNTSEGHRKIAEALQQMWAKNLNIRLTLHNVDWPTFLRNRRTLNYDLAREGWIADYPDPNAFLELFQSINPNNDTGWKNSAYDRLITQASEEQDPAMRMELLRRGEAILLDDAPILPIYTYASNSLIKPYMKGFTPSVLDAYPIDRLWIDREWREREGDEP